jgi:hypothetical protein
MNPTPQFSRMKVNDNFSFVGIWKGEYVYEDRFDAALVKKPVPFILRLKPESDPKFFSGICQDAPEVSGIDFPAIVYGTIKGDELVFVKKYPKTLVVDNGKLILGDEPHPDIIYRARIASDTRLYGTWQIDPTFRSLQGRVVEIPKITGQWWMERL